MTHSKRPLVRMPSTRDMGMSINRISLQPEGLMHGFVDPSAISALSTVICGPIRSKRTLLQAEMAARAFIMHDYVKLVAPRYKRQLMNSRSDKPHGLVVGNIDIPGDPYGGYSLPEPYLNQGLAPIANGAYFSVEYVTCDDQIFDCRTDEIAQEMINNYKGSDVIPGATYYADFTSSPVSRLFTFSDTYYEDILYKDGLLLERYLARLLPSGAPIYSGQQSIMDLMSLSPPKGSIFFSSIDKSWNQLEASWAKVGLNIKLPPFIYIAMNRAKSRDFIANEICALREEMADARNQLWGEVTELLFESSLDIMDRRINDLESQSLNIVPNALQKYRGVKFMRFFSRLIEMALAPASVMRVSGDPFCPNYIDASKILTSEIADLLPPLVVLTKHLEEKELEALNIAI